MSFPRRSSALLLSLLALAPQPAARQVELTKLTATGGAGEDNFGFSVAISGDLGVVGAPAADDNGSLSGAAYVFDVSTGAQLAELLPDDGQAGDYFGWAVAIEGTTVVVGAPFTGSSAGTVYVFDAATGSQVAELVRDDPAALDEFGSSVALQDGIAIAGSPGDSLSRGSAYLFDASSGMQLAKLLADDGSSGDHFGTAVGISGPTAVVSSLDDTGIGAAYQFNTATFLQTAKLLTSDGVYDDDFGSSVAIHQSTALVGSRVQETTGVAYLFDDSGAQTWKLEADDGAPSNEFGRSCAVGQQFAVVGAPSNTHAGGTAAGAVYVFEPETGIERMKLTASDGATQDRFGFAVALSDTTLLVGAPNDDDNGSNSGSVYVYRLTNGFCYGSSCLCGNDDAFGGCRNSTGRGGKLQAPFRTSLAADDLVLSATDLPPGNLGLFVASSAALSSSTLVGDGRLCVGGGAVFRFAPQIVAPDGSMNLSALSTLVPPGYLVAGEDRVLQAWSRDVFCSPVPVPCPSPCQGGSNLTNAVRVRFDP